MTWLLISILTNTLLFFILKGFERYGVNTLHGIVVNYFVAGTTGLIIEGIPTYDQVIAGTQGVLWIPFVLGFLFISIFFTLARTAQLVGISVATVANKMSVVIPVIAAVLLYKETLLWPKIAGVLAALVAVWMTSKKSDGSPFDLKYLAFPIIIFIGSGIIDALVNHMQRTIPNQDLVPFMLSLSFMVALSAGIATISWRALKFTESVSGKSVIGGIILGIPNYFSIYAITQALDAGIMESSELYPVNNMGIVICSAVGALVVFREKLSLINWLGILLSVGAIALIAFGNQLFNAFA